MTSLSHGENEATGLGRLSIDRASSGADRFLMTLLLAFFISFTAQADSVTQECETLVKNEALKTGETAKDYAVRLIAKPKERYLHEESVRVCVASKVKTAFIKGASSDLCPNAKTGYKLECFREWVKSQPIGFSTQVVQLSATAADIAKLDRQNSALKQEVVLSMLLDSILIPLEKLTAPQSVNPKAKTDAEIQQLRENERKLFIQAKMDLIPLMESQIKKMSEAIALEPVDAKTQDWVNNSVKALQSRVDRIKLKQI